MALSDSDREMHIRFFSMHVKFLPTEYSSLDTSRMTLLYFSLAALDALGGLDSVDKKAIREWVYKMQVVPTVKDSGEEIAARESDALAEVGGFRGSPHVGGDGSAGADEKVLRGSHIAMTYTALAILVMLEDDLSQLSVPGVVESLKRLQTDSGSFFAVPCEDEDDIRFVYCACAISYMIGNWDGVDKEATTACILGAQTYEGAFGLAAGKESHGGSTYCAIASLWLMGKLDKLERKADAIRWCVARQGEGFQGRPNKIPDSCYSFWIGSSLDMLGHRDFIAEKPLMEFILTCMNGRYGGFAKWPGAPPDLLHAYYSLCGLSLIGYEGVGQIHTPTGISWRAAKKAGYAATEGAGALA